MGGVPEIIASGELGLVSRGGLRELADSLALALNKPWAAEALRWYAVSHSWQRTAQAVVRVLAAVAAPVTETPQRPAPTHHPSASVSDATAHAGAAFNP